MAEYFAHPTATIDDGAEIGAGTKIWHYSHIMEGAVLGEKCNIGQNVVISPPGRHTWSELQGSEQCVGLHWSHMR